MLGSRKYVEDLQEDEIENIKLMLNMDMVAYNENLIVEAIEVYILTFILFIIFLILLYFCYCYLIIFIILELCLFSMERNGRIEWNKTNSERSHESRI